MNAIDNASKFDPKGAVTLDAVNKMLDAFGVDLDKVELEEKNIANKNKLTNDEVVYVLYAGLRSKDLIETPKTKGNEGTKLFKTLTNYKEVTSSSMFKAAFISFLQNDILEDLTVEPKDAAERAFLATLLGNVANSIKD